MNCWEELVQHFNLKKKKTLFTHEPRPWKHVGPPVGFSLSLGSVDVVDGSKELLPSPFVYMRSQANVDQVG